MRKLIITMLIMKSAILLSSCSSPVIDDLGTGPTRSPVETKMTLDEAFSIVNDFMENVNKLWSPNPCAIRKLRIRDDKPLAWKAEYGKTHNITTNYDGIYFKATGTWDPSPAASARTDDVNIYFADMTGITIWEGIHIRLKNYFLHYHRFNLRLTLGCPAAGYKQKKTELIAALKTLRDNAITRRQGAQRQRTVFPLDE